MLRPPPGVAPPPGFMMPPGTLQQLPQGTAMPVSMYCSWAACSMTQICLSQTITCTTDGESTQSSGKLPNDAATHALFKFRGTLSSPLQEQMHAILFVSWQLLSCC